MKKNSSILFFFLSIFVSAFLIFKPLHAQTSSAGLLPPGVQQFFDNGGNPLSSGKVYFYDVGTTTFKDIYTSSAATVPYTNPITLNAGGKPPGGSGIYGIGLYRQVVKDRNGNLIWDAVTSPTGSGGVTPTLVGDGNLVGTVLPWSGLIAPNQYQFAYGQEISRTTYPEFFTATTLQSNVICAASSNTLSGIADTSEIPVGAPVELSLCVPPGTTVVSKTSSTVVLSNPSSVSINAVAVFFPWGNGNGTTTFNVPDLRGYVLAGRNNMGGTPSSRLNSTYYLNDPNGLGTIGGSQSHTITISEMAVVTPAGTNSAPNITGGIYGGSSNTNVAANGAAFTAAGPATIISASAPIFTGKPFGGGEAHSIVQPTIGINYIIKVTPDTSTSIATGVYSIGGMSGVISCGGGILCTGNTVSVNTGIFSSQTANLVFAGPASGSVSLPTFRSLVNADLPLGTSGYAYIGNGISPSSYQGFTQTGTGAVSRTWQSKNADIVSVIDYGASASNTAAQNVTAFQNAVNSVVSGGTLLIPANGYNINSPITFTKPIYIKCTSNYLDASTGNINFTSTTANMFVVNTSNWVMDGCYLNAAGTPTTSQAIVVGNDLVSVSDAAITATSGTLTSATAAWTSSSVGMDVNVVGAGVGGAPLFTQITSFVDAHTVVVSPVASTTVSGANMKYGTTYLYDKILNSQIVNFNKGVHFIAASTWNINNTYALNKVSLHIENQLSPDHGSGRVIGSYLTSPATTAGNYPIWWNSGGEIYVSATKLLGGQYGVYLNSNVGLTGVFTIAGSGIENCGTNAIFASNSAQFNDLSVTGTEIACGAPNILFDNASTSIVNTANIVGNNFQGGGGSAVDAGKVNYLTFSSNTINNGGGNPAIQVRSNCNNCLIGHNNIVGSTLTISNSSLTTLINDPVGMTFANLPTVAAEGSRIYITNGTSGSLPCTGGGTGSYATRQNAVWSCGSNTVAGGSNTQLQYNNAGGFGGITGATTNGTFVTLTTPVLGAATATSINKMAITAPATSSTLSVANGKTFVVTKTISLSGTDATTWTGPTISAPVGDIAAVQVFTASGTYTPTSGTRYAVVELRGAGGGGGGAASSASVITAGGGGQGEYGRYFWASPTGQTITIGAGGTAGADTGGTGGTGGTTSLGAIATAFGGTGGNGSTGTGPFAGGIGGTGGTGADFYVRGTPGHGGTSNGSTAVISGAGGGEGAGEGSNTSAVGVAGVRGGGGSGATGGSSTARVGGVGGDGWIIITEYY